MMWRYAHANLEGAEVLVVGGNVTETLVEGLTPSPPKP